MMSKSVFYAKHYSSKLIPKRWFRSQLSRLLHEAEGEDWESIQARVNYCIQLRDQFELSSFVTLDAFPRNESSAYKMDLYRTMKYFDPNSPFRYYFGDNYDTPEEPAFIKARSLTENSENAILLRLDSVRHYRFGKDPIPFQDKKDIALWRGTPANNQLRGDLMKTHGTHPKCDVQGTRRRSQDSTYGPKKISRLEQYQNKFLISIEGNDVATNTKWIMASNSLCFMPKPTRETWFMEGALKPGYHYVELRNDFSDLEEKIDYYSTHTDEALEIIKNAHDYVAPFRDAKRELLIELMVAQRYFDLCENRPSR